MKSLFLNILLFLSASICSAQDMCNPWAMSAAIKASLEEHDRQVKMKEKQVITTGEETFIKKKWRTLKEKTEKIQNRLKIVDLALQAIPSGYVISQEAKKIKENQRQIFVEIEGAPLSVAKLLPKEINFLDDLQMTMRLLAGIVLSYDDINQMERAERQILLDYALQEVRRLKGESSWIVYQIREIKNNERLKQAMIEYQRNQDKKIVSDIITNIKNF